MNTSHVTVSSYTLKQEIEATLQKIEDSREAARRNYVAEKLIAMRSSWWRKWWSTKPIPDFDALYSWEAARAVEDPYHPFHAYKQRHGAQAERLALMLKAVELHSEVILTLEDLKYLGKPVHTPMPMIFPH